MENFIDYKTEYPFLQVVKDKYSIIKEEYISAVNMLKSKPYYEATLHNGKWEVIGLRQHGHTLPIFPEYFPKLYKLVENLPQSVYTIGFSKMLPGAEIFEHSGKNAFRSVVRCHLGIITNPDCAIIVNGEKRTWEPGELILFNDDFRHSAHNRGKTERVILLFDIVAEEYKNEKAKKCSKLHGILAQKGIPTNFISN